MAIRSVADGTAVAQKTSISADGQWPLRVVVSGGKASILGWVKFANGTPKTFNGGLVWTRHANALAKTYPAGFTNLTSIIGAQYTRPVAGSRVLANAFWDAFFDGGNFHNSSVYFETGSNNKITTGPRGFSLTFTAASGLFSGKVTDPVTLKPVPFKGAVSQRNNQGYGSFINLNQSGRVFFTPD